MIKIVSRVYIDGVGRPTMGFIIRYKGINAIANIDKMNILIDDRYIRAKMVKGTVVYDGKYSSFHIDNIKNTEQLLNNYKILMDKVKTDIKEGNNQKVFTESRAGKQINVEYIVIDKMKDRIIGYVYKDGTIGAIKNHTVDKDKLKGYRRMVTQQTTLNHRQAVNGRRVLRELEEQVSNFYSDYEDDFKIKVTNTTGGAYLSIPLYRIKYSEKHADKLIETGIAKGKIYANKLEDVEQKILYDIEFIINQLGYVDSYIKNRDGTYNLYNKDYTKIIKLADGKNLVDMVDKAELDYGIWLEDSSINIYNPKENVVRRMSKNAFLSKLSSGELDHIKRDI